MLLLQDSNGGFQTGRGVGCLVRRRVELKAKVDIYMMGESLHDLSVMVSSVAEGPITICMRSVPSYQPTLVPSIVEPTFSLIAPNFTVVPFPLAVRLLSPDIHFSDCYSLYDSEVSEILRRPQQAVWD